MVKRTSKTTVSQIYNYWLENNNISELDLNFDWIDGDTHCWNCGDNKKSKSTPKVRLERCHIIPYSLGGEDIPSNYVLLCNRCHGEAPNNHSKDAMWDWIKSNYIPISLTGTYRIKKALIKFKKTQGYSFIDKAANISDIIKKMEEHKKTISLHKHYITESTWYYFFKSFVEKYHGT